MITGPKQDNKQIASTNKTRFLYDVPLAFESREFLRKKLIGKNVLVKIDYEQPKTEQFPEKICTTVYLGEINIAVALVLKGFAQVIKKNNGQKSCDFDSLLEAETKAQKANKGLFAKNSKTKTIKPNDVSADANRAQFQLESLSKGMRLLILQIIFKNL